MTLPMLMRSRQMLNALGTSFVMAAAAASLAGCGSSDTITEFDEDTGTTDETAADTGLETGDPGDTGTASDGEPAETLVSDSAPSDGGDATVTDSTLSDTALGDSALADTTLSDTALADTALADTADAPPPLPTISITDVTINEGNSGTSPATFSLTLSSASTTPITVTYATSDGTAATTSGDYVAAGGTVTFPAGSTTQAITVLIDGDTLYENNETFTVDLSLPMGATLAKTSGTGTIINDDTAPTLSINDVSALEGNAATTPFVFTVTLSAPSAVATTVNYATVAGTATAATDFTSAMGTLTFAPGDIAKAITVSVVGDTAIEGTETFTLALSAPSGATVAKGVGLGTILEDDSVGGVPTVAISDATVTEGNGGPTTATFNVTLSVPATAPVTVTYATTDGTAVSGGVPASGGNDYGVTSGTLNFAIGETTKSITVTVNGDLVVEPTETFTVNLTGATGATIADPSGLGTITTDDATPTLSINDISLAEGTPTGFGSSTTAFTFTVTLSAASSVPVEVTYATANGTATGGTSLFLGGVDYQSVAGTLLTFAPGQTTKNVTINVKADATKEELETFVVNLTAPKKATIVKGTGTGSIVNDD